MIKKLLIFVVESKSKKFNTDGKYIKSTIDFYYEIGNDVIIKYVYMNGKGNYKKKNVIKEINSYIKLVKQTSKKFEIFVLYVLDKDNIAYSIDDKKLNLEIIKYCEENRYQIIWMNRNVEDVYWQKHIEEKDKVKSAIDFERKNQITFLERKTLSSENALTLHSSNILCVLDKILYKR